MADPIQRFEAGDTRRLTATYSSIPGTTPYLAIYAGSGNATLVKSQTATATSSTSFQAFFTMPSSRLIYAYAWVASFTSGPLVTPGTFQVVLTAAE